MMSNTLTDSDHGTTVGTAKQRVAEIDIAKAIGVIYILIGHRTTGVIHNYIYLFHMPLFFILSGYMIKGEKLSFRQIVLKENKLLSSYFVYSVIFILFDCFKDPGAYSFAANVVNTCTLFGIHALWFLSSLWAAKLIIRTLDHVQHAVTRHAAVITIYSVSYGISLFLVDLDDGGVIGKLVRSLSWSMARIGVILIFVYLGYVLKPYITLFLSYLKKHFVLCVLFIFLSGILLIPFAPLEEVDYHLLKNGLFLLNIVYGGIGTLFTLSISIIMAASFKKINGFFTGIGKNSIHYMASEYFGFSRDVNTLFGVIFPSLPYMNYLSFGIYLILLYFAIGLLGAPVNKGIDSLTRRLNSLSDKNTVQNSHEINRRG